MFRDFPRLLLVLAVCVGLLETTQTSAATGVEVKTDELTTRVHAVLAQRGWGVDTLAVIDNIVSHESPPPLAAPPLVRELLRNPLAAADVPALLARAVPHTLQQWVQAPPMSPARNAEPVPVIDLLVPYLADLAQAQRMLKSATGGAQIDAQSIIRQLDSSPPTAGQLVHLARVVDAKILARANAQFLEATTRFVAALRTASGKLRFPTEAVRLDSTIGMVLIGTTGDDVYDSSAALIIDPGGNDTYTRAPATNGAVSVIVDLGGNDRYLGSDVAVHGFSAIVDLAGDDRYQLSGPGLGATIVGAALVFDYGGDDVYEAGYFAQGAAAFGIGALIDMRGNDTYRLRAGGQGYGMAGGIGLLWDRDGNDNYTAAGLADAFARGGGVSAAQGAAFGSRTSLGGGIGILRDDAGNDTYIAEMFAQGTGFYYGVGVLWDRGGDDRYQAVRYAQGSGVHEAVGVLRDESGNDRYALSVGVGQGMGLDLAVGLLLDGAGDDHYQAPALAQGAATANGLGIVFDADGADQWQLNDQHGWGRAEWLRGLPTVGVLLYDPSRATFTRAGEPMAQPPDSAAVGGPYGGMPVAYEASASAPCPKPAAATADETLTFVDALNRIVPGLGGGAVDAPAFAEVRRYLTTAMPESIARLPREDFNASWALGEALRCVADAAPAEEMDGMRAEIERVLMADSASVFAGPFVGVLFQRPASDARTQNILRILAAHPSCGVRAAALRLSEMAAVDDTARKPVVADARAALGASCWRLRAAAHNILRRMKVSVDANTLPTFLRTAPPQPAQ